MSAPHAALLKVPHWAWVAPVLGGALLALKYGGLIPSGSVPVLAVAVALIGYTVFAAVHQSK